MLGTLGGMENLQRQIRDPQALAGRLPQTQPPPEAAVKEAHWMGNAEHLCRRHAKRRT